MARESVAVLEADNILSRGLNPSQYGSVCKLFADAKIVREFVAQLVGHAWDQNVHPQNAVRILDVPLHYYVDQSRREQAWPTWPHIIAEIIKRCIEVDGSRNGKGRGRAYESAAVFALNDVAARKEFLTDRVAGGVQHVLESVGVKLERIVQPKPPPPAIAVSPRSGGPQPVTPRPGSGSRGSKP